MSTSSITANTEKTNHSKMLSSFFCSTSIILLSMLCLLNNLSLDFYSACMLLRVVIPASFCFWFLGYSIGRILDNNHGAVVKNEFKLSDSNEAYTIPSMFGDDSSYENSDSEVL